MGNLLGVVVHAAHIHDIKAGIFAAQKSIEAYPSIKACSADAGYRKTFKQEMQEWFSLLVDISEKISGSWQIIPKRWIVERSFAWLGWSRRLAKDFEVTLSLAENFVTLAAIWQILKHFSD